MGRALVSGCLLGLAWAFALGLVVFIAYAGTGM